MPAQCFIRPSIQRSPQYTVHATQAHRALTWFIPPIETVARGVAAEQSPASWSHRLRCCDKETAATTAEKKPLCRSTFVRCPAPLRCPVSTHANGDPLTRPHSHLHQPKVSGGQAANAVTAANWPHLPLLLPAPCQFCCPSVMRAPQPPSPSQPAPPRGVPPSEPCGFIAKISGEIIKRGGEDTIPPTSDSRGEDQDYTCRHCDRTFTSHIGLVSHLRIHRTKTGGPVPGTPTYTHSTRIHCPHCPRTFTRRMGLFGHMRIHESGIDHPPYSPTTSNPTPTSSPIITSSTITAIATDTDTTDFACPHCPRAFTSRLGLISHLRIHRTETGEPVPGAPTYTHSTRLHCPHCPRTFTHRMGLLGHMRIHGDLR
nr:unnamed protein product [Spirometra erinaceieuropaei]